MKNQKVIPLYSVSGWDKLAEKQLIDVSRIALQSNTEKSFAIKVFLKLNEVRLLPGYAAIKTDSEHIFKSYIFKKKGKKSFTISANLLATMIKKFDWLEGDITLFRPLKKIGAYPATEHRLYNITLEQFLFAENLYNAYTNTRSRNDLIKFVSVFYYPKGEEFEAGKTAKRKRRFLLTQTEKLFTVYLWYTGVKRWIMGKYPNVFNGERSSTPPDESILNLLSALNGGDITKNETILKTHVHEALFQLNLMAQKQSKNV